MATAAAAAVAKARRDIQHHFFSQDAVRADSAIAFEPASNLQRRQFERMQRCGIIREGKPGLYWIDIVAYDREMQGRYTRMRFILLILVLALLIGLLASLMSR